MHLTQMRLSICSACNLTDVNEKKEDIISSGINLSVGLPHSLALFIELVKKVTLA